MASSLKFIVALTLAVAAVLVSGQGDNLPDSQSAPGNPLAASSNDLILGKREEGDKLVANVAVKKDASLIGKKVIVKKTFDAPNKEITHIKARDLAGSNGASVEVFSGGIGFDSVTLRFKSQRFHGIDFSVQVYAKDSDD